MSLSEIGSIANEVSRWAVLVSLVYVAIQIRLSVRHTRAQIQQGTAARTISILLGSMNTEAISIWIEGNGGTPTPELIKQRQFYYHCGIAMVAMEDYFAQHEQRKILIEAAPSYCTFIDSLCTEETVPLKSE